MKKSWRGLFVTLLAVALVATACGDSEEQSLLDVVKENDTVRCGTRDALPGFAVLGDDGVYRGFDSDFCRAIAAAVLGDANKVTFVPLETAARFSALASGEIDVLVRNTTWTALRDGGEGAQFAAVTFYDGQGMMVAADSPYQSVSDMDGTTVCLVEGTTTQINIVTYYEFLGINLGEALSFSDTDLVQEAFVAGRCDGWTSDSSQLVALRSTYPEGPEALRILPDIFSKEPLAPAVKDGDTAWFDAVNWAVLAPIQAEEWGITSANVDSFLTDPNPNIRRFLGVQEGDEPFNAQLGLPADYAFQVIKQVGNYAEIYEEHIVPLGIVRAGTPNDQWFRGGLLYAPPYK